MKGPEDRKDPNLSRPLLLKNPGGDPDVPILFRSPEPDPERLRDRKRGGANDPKNQDINAAGAHGCEGHERRPGHRHLNRYALAGAVLASTTSVLLGYGEFPILAELRSAARALTNNFTRVD